jgi:hypothetical protein
MVPNRDDIKEIGVLNRVVRWTEAGIEYEADDKHVATIIEGVGLQKDPDWTDGALTKE